MSLDLLEGSRFEDRGISSILGFIVGLVLVTGSMAAVTYYIATAPQTGTTDESRDLQSAAVRSIETLTTSPGRPTDWHTTSDLWNDPADQIGLRAEGSPYASLDKIQRFQDGGVNSTILLRSFNLQAAGMRTAVTGQIVPVPLLQPPSSTTYALADGALDSGASDMNDVNLQPDSKTSLGYFEEVNPGFTSEMHGWTWRSDQHPSAGLGNTFPDTPWSVTTQMIPNMGGIAATYTFQEVLDESSYGSEAVEAARAYNSGQTALTYWHIVTHDETNRIHNSSGVDIGDHVLTMAYHQGSNGKGVGLWRSTDGMRTIGLLGGFDITGAEGATFSFDHQLNIDDGETTECFETTGDGDTTNNNKSCRQPLANIMFWNTTSDRWSHLERNATGCASPSGWDDPMNETTQGKWASVNVDLCEAVNHTSGKLWLALEWVTVCRDATGAPGLCTDLFNDVKHRTRLWTVDNLKVALDDGTTVYETNMEPGQRRGHESLFAAHGVDHSFYASADSRNWDDLVHPVRHFVEDGGNVVALAPGSPGSWLGQVGLQAVARNDTQHTETLDADRLIMRMPHDLPSESRAYAAHEAGWSSVQPANPTGFDFGGLTQLDTIQQTTEPDPTKDAVATLISGTPHADGGKVSAVGYNMTSLNDTTLRDELMMNLYTSTVFLDPTFSAQASELPETGTVPLHATNRVILAEVTESGDFQIPVKVTLYLWEQKVG